MTLQGMFMNMRAHFRDTPHDPEPWEAHPSRCFLCGLDNTHEIHDI